MSAAALQLTAVHKSYGATPAVVGFGVDVMGTELLALVGPSGCGKSTLLRLVAGLAAIDSGEIRIDDTVVDDGHHRTDPEDRHIGLVFQEHALFPHLTVAANIAFGLRRSSRGERQRETRHWLEVVGLADHAGRYPHELSGGERQRIALVRALAPHPNLILLDEPFASLDPNLRAQIRTDVVRILREAGTPAVFVTHDQAEALAIGDRIAVMHGGRLVQLGTPEDVYLRPRTRFVAGFMGEASFLPIDGASRTTELGPIIHEGTLPASAVLVVRPDDIEIDSEPGTTSVRATIVAAEFRGPTWSYTLRLPRGSTIRSAQPHGIRYGVGADVHVSVKPGRQIVVSADEVGLVGEE
jgi:iron(III) transport system ATP-binding protein